MRRIISVSLMLLGLFILGMSGQAQDRPKDEPKKEAPKARPDTPVREFMRAKLVLSHKVLEGVVLEDFVQIRDSAEGLRIMSRNAFWHMYRTPEYVDYSTEFQRISRDLAVMAEKKNLDGAAMKYVELTLNCVNCHKYVRAVPTPARASWDRGTPERMQEFKFDVPPVQLRMLANRVEAEHRAEAR